MKKVIIRPFKAADEQAVAEIIKLLPHIFNEFGRAAILEDCNRHHGVVAIVENKVVGFLIYLETYTEIEILWIAVDSKHQGCGIGRLLVQSVERKSCNQKIMLLKTGLPGKLPKEGNLKPSAFEGAIAFWQKMGYNIVTAVNSYWNKDNGAVIMAKYLWELE